MPSYFTSGSFRFLRELAANNERNWFLANKERYLELVQEPALAFISDLAPRLRKLSSHFEANARVQGGSLLRPYRDIRFSKDKTPYKTNIGMRFYHEAGSDIHAPGFYLHIEPSNSYAGVGLWRPEAPVARQIRQAIVEDPAGWKKAAHGKAFLSRYTLDGESLQKPPQGFDPEHPLVEDLKRKDFIAGARLPDRMVTAETFLTDYAALVRASVPYMRFLTEAMNLAF
ncbi:MAG TPA: TIGR02453 family protein [Acidimicrobiia bacterium]|nr:TIGR02453 family protein [Acidimicrobiia bacterium]